MSHGWIYVFIGGGLGSLVRFGIGRYFENMNWHFPAGTFIANAISCFLLGILLGWQLKSGITDQQRLLMIPGFCGGFSTFSTFSGESLKLFQNGQVGLAITYIAASILVGLLFVYLGWKMHETIL